MAEVETVPFEFLKNILLFFSTTTEGVQEGQRGDFHELLGQTDVGKAVGRGGVGERARKVPGRRRRSSVERDLNSTLSLKAWGSAGGSSKEIKGKIAEERK